MRTRALLLIVTLTLLVSAVATSYLQVTPSVSPGSVAVAAEIVPSGALALSPIGTYKTGVFNEGAAEIVAHDPVDQRLYITNADENSIRVLDITAPTTPTLVRTIDLAAYGAGVNSADFEPTAGLLAVAIEADPKTNPGKVVLFNRAGTEVNSFPVGALPDMLTFTADGSYILVANEGEPDTEATPPVDPDGSVSVINVTAGTVATATFTSFNGRENELRARGVRIFPDKTVAQDVEPEYIAETPDGKAAVVTLQEVNALGVVNLSNRDAPAIVDIVPLGLKDHSRGPATLTTYPFTNLPVLGTTEDSNQNILLGGMSGLWFEGIDASTGNYKFVTVPDRGPNGEPTDVDSDGDTERPFALPDYQARVVRFELNPTTGNISITNQLLLNRADGTTPITGRPNIAGVDETPVDLNGDLLPYDELGADMEGIVVAPDGSYWMVDEYRPAIYHFGTNGNLISRFVPQGTAALANPAQPAGTFGTETLPAEYSKRIANRGFEGMALDAANGILYAFIQTPLDNPTAGMGNTSRVIRMLGIDISTGAPVAEYVYLLERPAFRPGGAVDKIGDAYYDPATRTFYTVERDAAVGPTAKKYVFKFTLAGATNLLATGAPTPPSGETLEQQTPDELATLGITPVSKVKVTNLPSIGYVAGDKVEGLTMLPDGRLAVLNDNDFGMLAEEIAGDGTAPLDPNPVPIVLGIVSFPDGNTLDASDRDDAINLQNWPVYGMYMPDAISAFSASDATYFVTANEGDDRGEPERIADLTLDTDVFTNAATLQEDENLGRLAVSPLNGNLDGDEAYEQLWAYGSRSFTVWDGFGHLVYDSGDEFERIVAGTYPANFNATHDENDFDSRSDAKGPEPEGVTTGVVNGRTYAFIGLERISGVMVYDVTTPTAPQFVQYVNNRDFSGDPEAGTAGDLGPEGLIFIKAEDSPTDTPLLVVTNEVSGSTTIYEITSAQEATTLTLLHNNDGESSLLPISNSVPPNAGYSNTVTKTLEVGSAAAFKAVMDREIADARTSGNSVLSVYAGDSFLAGATLTCSLNNPNGPIYDALAQRQMPYDAHTLGNHEFDYGPDFLERFIRDFAINGQLTQPFLGANLDFSAEPGFADLVNAGGLMLSPITDGNVIGQALITTDQANGQRFGIVGVAPYYLKTISSPRNVRVTATSLESVATLIQTQVDKLYNDYGIRRIILVNHLQDIDEDQDMIPLLSRVDLAVAGGGDELLVNSTLPNTKTVQLLPGESAPVDGEYPIKVTDKDGRTVYIVTTSGNYKYVGRLDATFDANGEVTGIVAAESYPRRVIPTSTTATELGLSDVVTPDAGIVASVNTPIKACLEEFETPLARTEVLLDVSRSGSRGRETNAGNLVTDAYLYAYERLAAANNLPAINNRVVAVQNGGGIRQNAGDVLPVGGTIPGSIARLDTLNVLAFFNTMSVVQGVTPTDLKNIFERSVSSPGGGQFLQVAGLNVVYNPLGTAQAITADGTVTRVGTRVRTITLRDGTPIVQNGQVVAGAPNVSIVTNTFTANGGDNYPWLASYTNKPQLFDAQGVALTYEQAWVDYLRSFPASGGLPTIPASDERYQAGGEGRITTIRILYFPVIRK